MAGEEPYTMSISLNVLNHLGIGLYSNVPAVLSEVVANAWDADASLVTIDIDPAGRAITITDNGRGMTRADINEKYLNVGYNKREREPGLTPKGRHPMGRKGIGKLSVFSIASQAEVYSTRDGDRSALVLDVAEIRRQIEEGRAQTYHPQPLAPGLVTQTAGTRIVLREVTKSLTGTSPHLRKRLARRFSIIGAEEGFEVRIDGSPIGVEDRDYYESLEFLWYMGDGGTATASRCSNLRRSTLLDEVVDAPNDYRVSGWIGTVDERKRLEDQDNTISVLAHGKLIHEDILKDLQEGGVYASYLIGELNAEFMDLDDREDIVTSGRQSVKEDDERYIRLREYVRRALKRIEGEWTALRADRGTERALENPAIKEWYERLKGDNQTAARRLFGRIESLKVPDAAAKRELYKASMIAFETLALRESLSVLDSIQSEADFEMVASLFAGIDQLEAAHYYEIVKGRLRVIRQFVDVASTAKERVLQAHIFEHLWLLDPSWERASTDARIEESVMNEFAKVDAGLNEEERKGRIDIRYRTAAGKHIIIELKKYDRVVTIDELTVQVRKYRDALQKCLHARFPNEPHVIETICILGSPPAPVEHSEDNIRQLDIYKARYITYDELIKGALQNYQDYLDREKQVSELIALIDSVDAET